MVLQWPLKASDRPFASRAIAIVKCNPFYFGLLALVTLALAINTPLLLGDLPDWIQQGQQLAAHWMGHGDPRYLLKHFPVPNSTLTVSIAVLGLMVGYELAAKLIVLATTWILGLLTLRVFRILDPENAQAKSIVALSCLMLSSSLFNGYISYQIALCLLMGFVYWAVLLGNRSFLGCFLFALAIFFSHGAIFAIFTLLLVILAWKSSQRWQMLASLIVPFVLAGWYFHGQKTIPAQMSDGPMMHSFGSIKAWLLYKAYTFAKLGPFHNFELANGKAAYGKFPPLYYLGILTNLAFAGFLAVQCVLALKNATQDRASELGKTIAYALFAIVVFSLILPPSAYALVNPGERLLIPAVALILGLPGIKPVYWKPVATLVCVWLCATALFYFRAQTNYPKVQAARKQYMASSSANAPSAVADDTMSAKAKASHSLFIHHSYRFFYVYSAFREHAVAKLGFDTGLFYTRPQPANLAFDPQSVRALAYLNLPTPKGANLANALWAVDEAKRGGWDGIVVGLGDYTDPDNIDMSGFKAVVEEAAKDGLRTHLRLLQPADATISEAGVQEPSKWAIRYNGGQAWPQPYRLPASLAVPVAKLVWQKGIDTTVDAYKSYKLDPTVMVTAEAANEADMGGANGPGLGRWSDLRSTYDQFKKEWKDYGKSHDANDMDRAKSDFLHVFPESLWNNGHPYPEGTIEPQFFAQLRSMLEVLNDRGIKIFPLTLEGEAGKTGQNEIDSYTGPDVAWIAQHYGNRAGFNRFMTIPSSSPQECAANYTAKAQAQIDRMRKNPYLTGELFNTEFGMEDRPSNITGNFDIAEGRQAVLNAERQLDGIVGGGFFISFGKNKLEQGYNLFNQDRTPVGKFAVSPNHQ